MNVAILLSSLMGRDSFSLIMASIKTLLESMATWSYVTNIFVEECNKLKLVTEKTNKLAFLNDSGHAAVVTGRQNSGIRNVRRPRGGLLMMCFRCDRPGRFPRDCNRCDRGGETHSRRRSEEMSTGYKSGNRYERFGDR